MNPFELEEILQNYYSNKRKGHSQRILLFQLMDFVDLLIEQDNDNVREAYLIELGEDLKNLLKQYSAFGVEFIQTKNLLRQIDSLKSYPINDKINGDVTRIKNELTELSNILNGALSSDKKNYLSFPVLEKNKYKNIVLGDIEYFKISFSTNRQMNQTEFLLVPSLPEVEKKLKTQIHNSWNFATNYIKLRFNIKLPEFQVTISFVCRLGIYEGDSLGIVLTVEFIKELLSFIELRDSIYIDKKIMATGSLISDGTICPVGDSVIIPKLKIAFYSLTEVFILPIADLSFAQKELKKLNEIYPERILRLVPVTNINDFINRRDLIGIKKQNLIKWGGNKLIKNRALLVVFILFSLLSISFYYFNQDSNPSKLELVNGRFLIKNKQDKVLWFKETTLSDAYRSKVVIWNKYRFYDMDSDNKNELLIVSIADSPKLHLFDDDGKLIWSYLHEDSLSTTTEKFTGHFVSYGILDTIHSNNGIEVLVYVQHNTFYPTGIVKLDLKTGEKIGNILWHPGSITGGIIMDWNQDGKKEIIAAGTSNGMNRAYLFSIDVDKLNGTFPTSSNYQFLNMNIAKMNKYILFPKTDYAELFFPKYNAATHAPVLWNTNILSLSISEGNASAIDADFGYQVRLNRKLEPVNCIVGDGRSTIRDKLVNESKLNPPLTDSKEFLNTIMENIEYWNGEKFVKFK